MLRLTSVERDMLVGKHGDAAQFAMQKLTGIDVPGSIERDD